MTYDTAHITKLVCEALGVPEGAVSVHGDRVEIEITQGITFAMMQALSAALSTDRINVEPATGGRRWSSNTYDEGYPARLIATIGDE